ncbi:DUF2934 domain-containing protein [Limnoglobus roseus]|uniref:DUF2934 domain-containing protein n=1 Tax=Limnoglobus roseus TaxID=2598579 RepID=A0A5C1ALQ5_9BACT|nr:DUF2934 domain-containing protein [Limnoglobus roseus]QEL20151.1 hypothetical protein PX52LOC_07239 [Limnoglobus roseus]
MFQWLFGKLQKRAQVRQSDRSERNAVIRRIVTAAATTTPKREAAADAVGEVVGPLSVTAAAAVAATESGSIPRDKIAERAYEIWLQNGRPSGTVDRDWLQAEREIAAERDAKPDAAPAVP